MATRKSILKKIVKVRAYLLKSGRSKKPAGEIYPHLKKVQSWLEFYPNASEQGVLNFYKRNRDAIHHLLPGKGNPARDSFLKELEQAFHQGH